MSTSPTSRPASPSEPSAGLGPLPVDLVLPQVHAALACHGRLVLEAPPGAGKTTRVPLALLAEGFERRLLVLEPRRVAARAAARRLAAGLGEPLGQRVGLTTRDERRVTRRTRIEVVTEGVLLRRLQRDPSIEEVGTILFDEFHERSLEGDLSLAFALEVRATLRPDLRLVVASATLDGGRIAKLLGDAPVVRAEGRAHPVTVVHRDPSNPERIEAAVVDAVDQVLDEPGGDVLVFLPGVREITRVAARLRGADLPAAPRILPLHGSLPPDEQDLAISPDAAGRRKVVLATDVAESSVTIDGVRTVVDAGRSREPRFDAATGMSGLVTVPASRAAARQRAGRAGRTGPGHCIRLWPEREHAGRDAHHRPAILTSDLTAAALEVAAWGTEATDLALLDQPPASGWARARDTLEALGALDGEGRITGHGRQLVGLPVHPRLGHLLLHGRAAGMGQLAVELAAVLADRDPLSAGRDSPCADLAARVRVLRGERPPAGVRIRGAALDRARRERDRLARLLDLGGPASGSDHQRQDVERLGELVLAGWPERLAAARPGSRGSFLLAAGRGAQLAVGDLLAGEHLLAVAHLDRGETVARIHLAAAVTESQVRGQLGSTGEDEIAWRDGDVVAERRERVGAVVLRRDRLPDPPAERLLAALLEGVAHEGIEVLGWTPAARELQARIGLVRRIRGASWPDCGDAALLRDAREVFGAFLLRARGRRDLASLPVADALAGRLRGDELRLLDRLAPTHLGVPSGSRIRLDYASGDRPVLAVRLQELFGALRTPTVLEGEVDVLIHLLSPAGRPVQVTDDLAGFWDRTYPRVRTELRGRYPKHAWPKDPTTATPVRGTSPRRRRQGPP